MTNVSGITGAGPLFHALMEVAMRGRPHDPLTLTGASAAGARQAADHGATASGIERVEVCALSGDLAGTDCPHRIAEWRLRENVAGAPACSMHERVTIDRRDGLRAGPECPSTAVSEVVFERFPPEFAVWAHAVGRPVAPRDWSPDCPGPSAWAAQPGGPTAGEPRIEYPLPGARFAIDPDLPRDAQRLDVRIVAPDRAHEAALVVDGRLVARIAAPFEASWKLEAGEHELVAEVDGWRSAAVRVMVRE
jgi:penicillin-binding protein 1C